MPCVSKIVQLFYPSIRRRYLYYFNRPYIELMAAKRKGSCEGCGGQCCTRTRLCPLLKDGKCQVYGAKVVRFCMIFPIDPQDITLSGVADVCQYYWEEE